MDTTLRDGEQTPNVSYTPAEKLQLARMLLVDLDVDRIEMASTRVSAGELESAQANTKWARKARVIQRVEMLARADEFNRDSGDVLDRQQRTARRAPA